MTKRDRAIRKYSLLLAKQLEIPVKEKANTKYDHKNDNASLSNDRLLLRIERTLKDMKSTEVQPTLLSGERNMKRTTKATTESAATPP
jgi:hypothetical protein